MPATLTTNLAKPIISAMFVDNCGGPASDEASPGAAPGVDKSLKQELEAQKAAFIQANQALKEVVGKLNKFCDSAFSAHKEEIARLSVEIARKILVQKVANGDYEIQSIVKEALETAPSHEDLVVHLNPDDLSQYEKLGQDEAGEDMPGVKFVADSNISQAECLLETPKGTIESVIDQHLDEVGKALMKVK